MGQAVVIVSGKGLGEMPLKLALHYSRDHCAYVYNGQQS